MSGFVNPDGSELVGGQKPTSVGQALQLDSSGNLLVNVAVGGGGGGGSASSVALNDGTTTTQKATIDASGNLHTQEANSANVLAGIGGVGDTAWGLSGNASEIATLKKIALLLNAMNGGSLGINLAEYAGVTPGLSNSDAQSGTNVPLFGEGLFNGTTIDRAIGVNGVQATQDWIRHLVLKGQGFNLTTGKVTNAAAGNFPAVLLNPANSTKNMLVYSIKLWFQGGSNTHELRLLTSDPAYTSLTSSIQNLKIGAATTSVAVAEYSTTTITPSGTVLDCGAIPTYTVLEFLSNGTTILLPAGQTGIQGLAAIAEPAQAGTWGVTYRWVEF